MISLLSPTARHQNLPASFFRIVKYICLPFVVGFEMGRSVLLKIAERIEIGSADKLDAGGTKAVPQKDIGWNRGGAGNDGDALATTWTTSGGSSTCSVA